MERTAGERKVYGVAAFNRRLATYLARVRDVWVEGEVSELRRNPAWANVFLTLKDAETGACLPATMPRRRFDLLEPRRARESASRRTGRSSCTRPGGPELPDRGARAARRRRPCRCPGAPAQRARGRGALRPGAQAQAPRFPRGVGLLTGVDAAARGDIVAAITTRYPAVRLVVAETRVQGPAAHQAIVGSSPGSRPATASTSSSSRAAVAASRICSPSATNASSGRSPRVRSRWCRPSATSRTSRSAISRPTSAR